MSRPTVKLSPEAARLWERLSAHRRWGGGTLDDVADNGIMAELRLLTDHLTIDADNEQE